MIGHVCGVLVAIVAASCTPREIVARGVGSLVDSQQEAQRAEEARKRRVACERGNAASCIEVANGLHVPEQQQLAYRQACELKSAEGCAALARFEPARALEHLERACELTAAGPTSKDAPGCLELGQRYTNGTGVEKDLARAYSYLAVGCRKDAEPACAALGELIARPAEETP